MCCVGVVHLQISGLLTNSPSGYSGLTVTFSVYFYILKPKVHIFSNYNLYLWQINWHSITVKSVSEELKILNLIIYIYIDAYRHETKKIDTFLNFPEKWSFHNYYCSVQKQTIACKTHAELNYNSSKKYQNVVNILSLFIFLYYLFWCVQTFWGAH